jgi:hypothetical protein
MRDLEDFLTTTLAVSQGQEATHNGDPTPWSAVRSAEGGHDAVA